MLPIFLKNIKIANLKQRLVYSSEGKGAEGFGVKCMKTMVCQEVLQSMLCSLLNYDSVCV